MKTIKIKVFSKLASSENVLNINVCTDGRGSFVHFKITLPLPRITLKFFASLKFIRSCSISYGCLALYIAFRIPQTIHWMG